MTGRIALIGNGRVARYFAEALPAKGRQVTVYARHPRQNEQALSSLDQKADLCLICVSDQAIAEVSASLPVQTGIVAHCSGATGIEAIDTKHRQRAVLYPLMSFPEAPTFTASAIPFCLEASDTSVLEKLQAFCESIDAQHYSVNGSQRPYLHLSAVLAHNFSNHLYHLAYQVMQRADMDFSMLKPLLLQSLKQLDQQDPALRQTGPARRGDKTTLEKHLALIDEPRVAEIYKLLTSSIQHSHEEEL